MTQERTLAKDLDGKTITIMLLVIAFTSFAITRSLLYHECQLKNDMTLFPEAWRLREEPLSRVISAAPVARDWLVAQLRESLAVMPSCRSLSRALAVDAAEIRLFRAARPTFVRISALAAKALHANLSVEVTQLKAAQKIKMLAEEVLRLGRADLSALRAREPEFAKGDDPEVPMLKLTCWCSMLNGHSHARTGRRWTRSWRKPKWCCSCLGHAG